MSLDVYLIPIATFLAAALASYVCLSLWNPYWRRVNSRIGELEESRDVPPEWEPSVRGVGRITAKLLAMLEEFSPNSKKGSPRLQKRLIKAGIYRSDAPSIYHSTRFLLLPVFILAFAVIAYMGYARVDVFVILTCTMGTLGAVAPSIWLDKAIRKRHLLLRKSLPDFLDLMTICLEGGLSLQETIKKVSEELRIAHPVLAGELHMVQRDIELGATVDQALKRFATRADYEGVRTLSTFIREAQRFGTSITDALRGHADMLRSQREQDAEESAQKASVKILLPTFLLIFPAIFIVAVGPAVLQIHAAFSGK